MFYVILYFIILFFGKIGSRTNLVIGKSSKKYSNEEYQKQGVNFFLLVSILILSLVAAFRPENVGADTKSYIYIFNLFKSGHSVAEASRAATTIENGYLLFSKIVVSIWSNRTFFFFCNAILIYTSCTSFIRKNSDDFVLSVLLFTALYYTSTFNVMRQYLAIGIFLFSLMLLQNEKYICSIFLLVIAFFIHRSLIIFAPIWAIYMLKIRKKGFIFSEIIIIISLIALQNRSILNWLLVLLNYKRLTNGAHFYASDSGGLMAYIYLIILILGFLVLYRANGNVGTYYYSNLVCASVGTACAFLAGSNEMFARAGSGYLFFVTLLYPSILEELFGSNKFSYKVAEIVTILLLGIGAYVSGRGYSYFI